MDKNTLIQKVKALSLPEVLAWKKAFGRAKDLADVTQLQQYLKARG